LKKVAIVQFPGSCCDRDVLRALANVLKLSAVLVWHSDLKVSMDAVVLPGGFSFGDRLRPGAIAAFLPAVQIVKKIAAQGKPVLGIGNGFQILCEAELLPGVLLRNDSLEFICRWVQLRVENSDSAFTCCLKEGSRIRMPISHMYGRFYAENSELDQLEDQRRVLMTYCENPNGTSRAIAAICNEERNVVGMMPHPERASEPILGGSDGLKVFQSMLEWAGW
jgi:phosphoribosylformylglycinamidine synthase I